MNVSIFRTMLERSPRAAEHCFPRNVQPWRNREQHSHFLDVLKLFR